MILNIKAAATPNAIIFFLLSGAKFAAINPIIIALSAARIISIKIICESIKASSIKVVTYIKYKSKFQIKLLKI